MAHDPPLRFRVQQPCVKQISTLQKVWSKCPARSSVLRSAKGLEWNKGNWDLKHRKNSMRTTATTMNENPGAHICDCKWTLQFSHYCLLISWAAWTSTAGKTRLWGILWLTGLPTQKFKQPKLVRDVVSFRLMSSTCAFDGENWNNLWPGRYFFQCSPLEDGGGNYI